MITITKLKENRWEEYKAIRLEALQCDSIAFGSSYEEEIQLSEEEWKKRLKNVLFAMSDDMLVGLIVYVCETKNKLSHTADIYSVYVNSKYRGQGIGKNLLRAAIEEIQKHKKILKKKLSVIPEQKRAMQLYQKFGFEKVGELKKEFFINGVFYNQILMEKLLDNN